jgi:hypothetical protein
VWIPASATPDRVSAAPREAFTKPLTDAAEEIAAGFGVDGDLAVAAVALLDDNLIR